MTQQIEFSALFRNISRLLWNEAADFAHLMADSFIAAAKKDKFEPRSVRLIHSIAVPIAPSPEGLHCVLIEKLGRTQ
jgi:hypothetical protein